MQHISYIKERMNMTLLNRSAAATMALMGSLMIGSTAEAAYIPLPAEHNILTNGDFEASLPNWSSGWQVAGTVSPSQHDGLISGSDSAAKLVKNVKDFSNSASQISSSDWTLDFFFAGSAASAAILDLRVAPLAGSEAIALRVLNGGAIEAAQSSTWQSLAAAGTVTESTFDANGQLDPNDSHVYRMRLVGHDFGTASPTWDLLLATSADFESFTTLVSGSTIFQTISSATGTAGVGKVVFRNDSLNANNHLVVDDVWLGTTVPEPASVALAGLAGAGLLGRRVRRQG